MAIAIVGGLLVLLLVGLVVAITTAVQARRDLEDLEDEFAEHRGVAPDHEDTRPWSSIDFEVLREDTEVAGPDPYATLTSADAAVSWHALDSNGWEPEPNGADSEPNGSDAKPKGDLAAIEDLSPFAWRATADAPVIVLVVGAGFLGTGVTAGVTTASRLRRAWGDINSSFAEAGVIQHDAHTEPMARPSHHSESTHDDVPAVDARSWSHSEGPGVDLFPPSEEDARINPSPRSNRFPPQPPTDPERITWRPPTAWR